MRTVEQAREEAIAWLAASEFSTADPTLIDSSTEEFPAGWVYRYQSAEFLRTGDFKHCLLGNAPLFIPRNDAKPQSISYHRPTSESAEAFSCCGDANAQPNAEVRLKGARDGARKVSATKAIRAHACWGLAAAHGAVDRCLSGQPTVIKTPSVESARELAFLLQDLGFLAGITYGSSLNADDCGTPAQRSPA